jgi:hypothetical protein
MHRQQKPSLEQTPGQNNSSLRQNDSIASPMKMICSMKVNNAASEHHVRDDPHPKQGRSSKFAFSHRVRKQSELTAMNKEQRSIRHHA